jgi:hypothetical protein
VTAKIETPVPDGLSTASELIESQSSHDISVDVSYVICDAGDDGLFRRHDQGIEDPAVIVDR